VAQLVAWHRGSRDVAIHERLIPGIPELDDDVPDGQGKTRVVDQLNEKIARVELPVSGTVTQGHERVVVEGAEDQVNRRLRLKVGGRCREHS
jgi:hypothetical protein